MTNIKNYNFTGIDFKISNSEYYDFYLNTDGFEHTPTTDGSYDFNYLDFDNSDWYTPLLNAENHIISEFNFDNYNSLNLTSIESTVSWGGSYSTTLSAATYGLTSLDNGFIFYDKSLDGFGHLTLIDKLTGTTLNLTSGDTSFNLNLVSGYTGNFVYPTEFINSPNNKFNYVNFCGGFYQGYYKLDGYNYQSMPLRYQKGWTIETWLNKREDICSGSTGQTLNDLYPDNKGFFYYNGTRAENKFWNIFTGNTTGCTSGSTDFCTEVKETEVNINNITVDGSGTTISVPLSPPPIDISLIKNNFLVFGRSQGILCAGEKSIDGYGQVRADRYYDKDEKRYSRIVREVQTDFTNPFLIFGRSQGILCAGEKSSDGYGQVRADRYYEGTNKPLIELEKDKDLIGNALGFRIKDDGSIGYRMLILSADCKSVEVIEEYSLSGVVNSNKWEHVVIKWVNNNSYEGCDLINGKPRKGRFKFYINSFLIFVSKEIDEFVPKRLDDLMEKQIGVPFNISIGGGTQGLIESMTFDGQDPDDLGLIVEKQFAGSFIGSISTFNSYDTSLSWCSIKELYNERLEQFK